MMLVTATQSTLNLHHLSTLQVKYDTIVVSVRYCNMDVLIEWQNFVRISDSDDCAGFQKKTHHVCEDLLRSG